MANKVNKNYKINEYVVYPSHGVGKITDILEQEIILAIDQIKNKVKSSIIRRNELQKRTVDISHSSLTVLHNNPRYKLLTQLELELEEKSTRFNDSYSKWKSARNDYSITMISK